MTSIITLKTKIQNTIITSSKVRIQVVFFLKNWGKGRENGGGDQKIESHQEGGSLDSQSTELLRWKFRQLKIEIVIFKINYLLSLYDKNINR